MKRKNIKPAVKNSFFVLYQRGIRIVLKLIGICGIAFGFYTVYRKLNMSIAEATAISLFATTTGIITIYVIHLVYFYFVYLFNQRRIPLSNNEIQMLNLHSTKEYVKYIEELLCGYYPKTEVLFLLLISAYNYFEKNNCNNEKLDLNEVFYCDNPNLDLNELTDFSVTNRITIKSYREYRALVRILFDEEGLLNWFEHCKRKGDL